MHPNQVFLFDLGQKAGLLTPNTNVECIGGLIYHLVHMLFHHKQPLLMSDFQPSVAVCDIKAPGGLLWSMVVNKCYICNKAVLLQCQLYIVW